MKEGSNSFKETAEQNTCEAEIHQESNVGESDQEYVNNIIVTYGRVQIVNVCDCNYSVITNYIPLWLPVITIILWL